MLHRDFLDEEADDESDAHQRGRDQEDLGDRARERSLHGAHEVVECVEHSVLNLRRHLSDTVTNAFLALLAQDTLH